jgi:hypothetical protein
MTGQHSQESAMTEYLAGASRVYRMKWWRRAFPIVFIAFSLVFLFGLFSKGLDFEDQKQIITLVVAIVFLLVGSYMTISAFKSTITLSANSIELLTLKGRQQLALSAIRGRREYWVNTGRSRTRYLRLEPDDDRLPTMDFEKSFTFDDSFYAWFNALPDLDADDKKGHKESDFGLV